MVDGRKYESMEKNRFQEMEVRKMGEKDEEIIQGTDDTGIISRNMRYSQMVENITNYTFLL